MMIDRRKWLISKVGHAAQGRTRANHVAFDGRPLESSGLAVMEQLSGIRTAIDDPFMANVAGYPGQALMPHQEAAIAAAAEALAGL